ncbi:MAG: hydroxyacid dehydrogenase [Anaerolineae bacterium]|jgi:D-3-phosphoglycerate dehydrogenase
MKVLVCDPIAATAVERMREAGIEVTVRDRISAQELAAVIPAYEGLVVRSRTQVRAPLIDVATRLKVIVRGGVGLDNIDVDHARARGITVLNTPSASSASVAELAVGYLFALARHIPQASDSMRAGLWEKKRFRGDEIGGKTLGIVGIGRIGREVARRAAALGMRVVAHDPYVSRVEGVDLLSLDELLACSDYITLHLPHTEETHDMIGVDEFARMKKGVRVVNCARGGVVDEEALYEALLSGRVAGAALDVYAQEPCCGHKLYALAQVIGSPHIGAATVEAQGRVGEEVTEKMIRFYRENF